MPQQDQVYKWISDPSNRKTVIEAVKATGGDGHAIWPAEKFSMLPDFVRDYLTTEYESDTSHPRSTIFKDDVVVEKVKGIYGLRLLDTFVYALKLEGSHALGRGFRAQENVTILLKHLRNIPNFRTLREIAVEIEQDWEKPFFGALPYINAMKHLNTIDDKYGLDDGESVVLYFLSNARTWRGETARRVKAELRAMFADR